MGSEGVTVMLDRVEPNKHAPPPTLAVEGGRARFGGYQAFLLDGASGWPVPLRGDVKLRVKRELLAPYFTPAVMRGRTILDVGGNFGFFAFWGAAEGAARADVIDVDGEYVRRCNEAAGKLGLAKVRGHEANLRDWAGRADVVVALAMVHWLYSATTGYGSLEAVARELAARTGTLLLTEWVAPGDGAIEFLRHTTINVGEGAEAYSYAAFRSALEGQFGLVEDVGPVSGTRRLLACWRRAGDRRIRMDAPLPLVYDAGTVRSSSLLGTGPAGEAYWSRTYDLGDRFAKQGPPELIAREVRALRAMEGSGFVPRVLRTVGDDAFEMERIENETPDLAAEEAAARYFGGLLEVLRALREAGVRHRDIRPSNLMFRGGRPALLDFGWAEMVGEETFAPASLGEQYRPADGTFDDAYSVGKVMLEALASQHPRLADVAALMANEETVLRVSDVDVLSALVKG